MRRLYPLLLIILLALALRLIALETRSLWYDEAFAVLFAEKGLGAMLYGTLTPVVGGAADIHPLLYYTLLNGWMNFFGQSPSAVRLLSVLLGIVTVCVMYLLGRDLFGEKTGLAAAFITAIAPFHVQYAQETRMYSLMALLLLLATWCFVRGWQQLHARRWWLFFGVLCGLAMYAQQLSAFYLLALGLVPLLARRRDLLLRVGVGAALAVVIYAPWMVNIPAQLNKVGAYYWIPQPTIAQFLVSARSFLAGWLQFQGALALLLFAAANILVVFLMVQVIFWLRRPRRSTTERPMLLLVLWLCGAPVLLMWLFSQWRPVYLDRGLIASALLLYLALAWLFTRSGLPRPVMALLGTIGLGIAAAGLLTHYTWNTFPNAPFRAADAYIREQWQEGDVLLHQDKVSALPMIYYGRDLPQRYLGDLPGAADDTLALPTQETLGLLAESCIQSAARGARRVWFVAFAGAEAEIAAAENSVFGDQLLWLQTYYTLSAEQRFNDLIVYLYIDPVEFSPDC
ncbi:MAG: glycosyltransferase family 39 protein [Chloroflexi bacterium]|nr:glycosyltransferase family 39 protein [Chloroflexota bacterium]